MGRATRWFSCVLCIKKVEGHSRRESVEKLCSNPSTIKPNVTPAEAAWLPNSFPNGATAGKTAGEMDADENWMHSNNSSNNLVKEEQEQDDEESLSLNDLPIDEEDHHQTRIERTASPEPLIDSPEGFSFRSWNDSLSKESEICIADEVFSQGQILPMSSQSSNFDSARITSRSISMDHFSHSAGFTSVSSRSSSVYSHHSSSCGGSVATRIVPKTKPRTKIQDQFQFFQRSPKSQIQYLNVKNGGRLISHPNRKPTFWRFFRVGLVTTPETAVQDLKFGIKGNARTKNLRR